MSNAEAPAAPFSQHLMLALLKLSARLPLSLLRGLGRAIGTLAFVAGGRSRQVTETNLRLCFPERSQAEIRRLARASLQDTVTMALEMGPAWFWPVEKICAHIHRVDGEHLYREALAQGRGLLLLVPHLGNWEVVGMWLGEGMTALYQPPRQALLDPVIRAARQRSGGHLVPTTAGGVRSLLKALREGRTVAILPDQVPETEGGVFAPFMGVPALTMTLANQLLRRRDAPVLLCSAYRNRSGGFDLAFLPVDAAIYSEDAVQAATALNAGVEALLAPHPEQYQWEYKRFRKQPPGAPKIY